MRKSYKLKLILLKNNFIFNFKANFSSVVFFFSPTSTFLTQNAAFSLLLFILFYIKIQFTNQSLQTTYPQLPTVGLAQLRIFNGNPCNVAIHNDNITYTIPAHSNYVKKDFKVSGQDSIAFELNGGCITPRNEVFPLTEERANSYFLDGDEVHGFFDNLDKSKSGLPVVR